MVDQYTPQQQAGEAQFLIQRIYTKNSSFESREAPAIFKQKWEPELNLEIDIQHCKLEEDIYEVCLVVTATVKNKATVAFIAEVVQGGIFTIKGASTEQLSHLLGSFCPNILFPYAREEITSSVIRGSFPQLVLAPINFDALYEERHSQKASKVAQPTEPETAH